MFKDGKLFNFYERAFGVSPGYYFRNGISKLSHSEKRALWKNIIKILRNS